MLPARWLLQPDPLGLEALHQLAQVDAQRLGQPGHEVERYFGGLSPFTNTAGSIPRAAASRTMFWRLMFRSPRSTDET